MPDSPENANTGNANTGKVDKAHVPSVEHKLKDREAIRPGAGKKGLSHVLAATGNSWKGAKVILGEEAAKQEILCYPIAVAILWFCGAGFVDYLVVTVLFLILLAFETLNTAIENVVDHTSPGFSQYAADTKDLGSFAVFCLLAAIGGYMCAVVARYIGWINW